MTPAHPEDRTGVVIVGSVTADVTTFSGRLPARGETILGDEDAVVAEPRDGLDRSEGAHAPEHGLDAGAEIEGAVGIADAGRGSRRRYLRHRLRH